jgi:PAS domain S-box-containing protein
MRALVQAYDWAATPLGAMAQWPVALHTVVALVLDSAEPLALWWGPELRQIYNDAYAPRLGKGALTTALGQSAGAFWRHNWEAIGPEVVRVLAGERARFYEDVLIDIRRNGRLEDTYWNYSFTPVRDGGDIGGVLLISTETTARVLTARRQASLNLLRREVGGVDDCAALTDAIALAVAGNPGDLAGAAIASAHPAAPAQVRISAQDVGVDIDFALDFSLSPRLPLDSAFRLYLEQFTLLVAAARLRIDNDARRRIVEAERDRLLLDAPVGAAVMVGDDLVYRLVNAIYAQVSGRPASAMEGRAFTDVFPELDGSPVHGKFKEVYRAGVPFISQPTLVQIHRHGGALDDRYFTYNLSPLRTLDGKVYGLMVIAVDITTEVNARAQVEQLNADLQAAARAKDEFLALLGHELRNPLAPIVTALELMRLRDRSSEREQVVIRRQVSHLTRLVDDLLDVSRITRGKVELRKETVDVREVLLGAVEMVAPLIGQQQQLLHVDVAPLRWHGDPARLAQIVSNLLTNAARYSPQGASIALIAAASDGELEIEVSDTGMGLPADLLARIFEPFVQGERKLRSSAGGLGVGLALVKNLVEMHGGSVVARSDGAEQGSTFIVRLPLPALPVNESGLPDAVQGSSPDNEKRRVLIVDDNHDAADLLAEMLRVHGHHVSVAYEPETALQAFGQQHIDVAILDLGLPGMSGYELAAAMRSSGRNPAVRIMALTGYGQASDMERSHAAGFTAHWVKPVDWQALLAAL